MSYRAYQRNGVVRISERTWDGIDKPEHTDIAKMPWGWAVSLAKEIVQAAEAARQHLHAADIKKLEELRKQKAGIDAEVESLAKKVEAQ